MGRLILITAMVVALVATASIVSASLTSVRASAANAEDRMPNTVKTVSYILLILLMFGIVTGVIGGL